MRYFTKPIIIQLITMEVLYFLIVGVCFFIWPTSMESAFMPLLFLYPIMAFVIPLYSFASRGFNPVWPWATFVLFLPPMVIIFNATGMIYGVLYTAISAIGCVVGAFIHHMVGRRDAKLGINQSEPGAVG